MLIQLKDLRANKLNSNVMPEDVKEKLKENIKASGLYPPLIVRAIKKPPSKFDKENTIGELIGFRIIDGHNRKWVLEQLKYEAANCEVWEMEDKTELFLLATINELKGTSDFSKRAILLSTIIDFGISRDNMLKLIPEDDRRLDFVLSLVSKKNIDESLGLIDSIDQKRAALREKFIKDGFSPKHAEAMADIYAYKDYVPKAQSEVEGKKVGVRPILIFFFNSQEDFEKAVKFFEAENDKEPNTQKLLDLIK